MKSTFETLVLTLGLIFTCWVIITAGVKFEMKIKGQEYGVSVGGATKDEKMKMFVDCLYWSHPKNTNAEVIFTKQELENVNAKIFEDFIRTVFPHVLNCQAYAYGELIFIELQPCDYPQRPVYTYLPKINIDSEYDVIAQNIDFSSIKFLN